MGGRAGKGGTQRETAAKGAQGLELLRLGRCKAAAVLLEEALAALAKPSPSSDARDAGSAKSALLATEWTAGLAWCLIELGRYAEAALRLKRLKKERERRVARRASQRGPAAARAGAADALALLCEGRLLTRDGKYKNARIVLDAAKRLAETAPETLLLARVEFQLGGVLAMGGEIDAAIALWQSADRRLAAIDDRPGSAGAGGACEPHRLLHARLAMNRGIASADLGRHSEAAVALREALLRFEWLAQTAARGSRAAMRAEMARALRNQAFAVARTGRHAEAVPLLERALVLSQSALRAAKGSARREAWRVSLGGACNSYGYTLLCIGRLDEAKAQLLRAARLLGPAAAPAVRARGRAAPAPAAQSDELARTWINRAHLEAHRGQWAAARRFYARAAVHFAARHAAGEAVSAADRLNAEFGLARAALRRGRIAEAAARFGPAMAELSALTRQGQLQHASAWLCAWQAQRDTWLAHRAARRAPRSSRGQRRADAADAAAADMLVRALAAPPHQAVGLGPDALLALAEAARGTLAIALPLPPKAHEAPASSAANAATASGSAAASAERVAVAYLGFLLDWMAELLGERDPHWIHAHHAQAEAAIEALRLNAAQRTEAAPMLARWFLATRGLRAQRSALTEGDDASVDRLRGLLRRLHRIEQEILGERAAPSPGDELAADLRHAEAMAAPAAGAGGAAGRARFEQWHGLRDEVARLRSRLVGRGLLPAVQRLEPAQVLRQLAPGQALLLLARPQPERLLVLALHRAPGSAAAGETPPARGAGARAVSASGFVEHTNEALAPEAAAFPCATLHALARSAWVEPAAPALEVPGRQLSEPDRFALAMFSRLWQSGLEPTLQRLQRAGITAVDLVPSGDLHLVPWNHFADQAWPGRFRLYPSAGAWWRCQTDAAAAAPPRRPRWALAAATCAGADGRALPWAEVESRLSRRLWGAAMQPLRLIDAVQAGAQRSGRAMRVQARERAAHRLARGERGAGDPGPVDALLGVGHGSAPDRNAARTGLLAGSGTSAKPAAWLQPHHLPRLRRCRHALMSACYLGHTDGTAGEALGFLSGCFDHRFVFASGWLAEVDDRAACLYSLAAQWCLQQRSVSPLAAAGASGWSDTLAHLRRQLLRGQWASGFHAWLVREWPAGATARAPSAPPPDLQRALPWVVTLG